MAQEGHQTKIWTSMPGLVQSYDPSTMTCTVQLAIQGVSEDQNGVQTNQNLPLLVDVPVVFPSGGGFTMAFPLKPDDEVLVHFAARCIDSWWQNGGFENQPMEDRMHDLSDAFAVPGPRSIPRVIPGLGDTDLVIADDDGNVLFSIDPTGNVVVKGNLQVGGNITAPTGDIEATAGDVMAGTISLKNHIHTGGTLAGGKTGAPVP